MRRVVFVCLTLVMLVSSIYALKSRGVSQADYPRVGYPVASIGDVFRHY